MRRWKVVASLTVGAMYLLACDRQADQAPITLVDDSPVLGMWYLQAVGADQPIALDITVCFKFGDHGQASYERTAPGDDEPVRHALVYNVSDQIISIDSNSDVPGVPRITGQIELDEQGQTLRILTHTEERWLLTREAMPGGAIQAARDLKQNQSRIDPHYARVQQLAYAWSQHVEQVGSAPAQWMDLINAGLVTPQALTRSGQASELPGRYAKMSDEQRAAWLDDHSAFVLCGQGAELGQSRHIVVCALPTDIKSKVVVGMANGAVYLKSIHEAAQLLHHQEGVLPDRWPGDALTHPATAGAEPLSD